MTSSPLLHVSELSKTFGTTKVLHQFELSLQPGEIHAILGHNGSGKSTVIKLLSGYHSADPGARVEVNGEPATLPLPPHGPVGIAFMHQDLGLLEGISIAENFAVGAFPTRGPVINWRRLSSDTAQELETYGVNIRPSRPIDGTVSPGQRALIALARAVRTMKSQYGTGVLVLDEPTVYLTDRDTALLHAKVRELAAEGIAVVYITHRLKELYGFAEKLTVLRDGRIIFNGSLDSLDRDELVALIAGSPVNAAETPEPVRQTAGSPILTVRNLRTERLNGVSFDAFKGEILGLAGLVGMGQDDIVEALFGSVRSEYDEIFFDKVPYSPEISAAVQSRFAFLPADRPRRSGAIDFSVSDNITLPVLKDFVKRGRLDLAGERRRSERWAEELGVIPRDTGVPLRTLSGGNQQKALLAKWLQLAPRLLLLIEPVQGVDVGAKRTIFDRIRTAARDGATVIVASTEHEDLADLCDRVLVVRDGDVVDEIAGSALDGERILRAFHG
ncbi:sugar ABC transporter ATP-binding protein [Microbacterium sp. BR1]|uniref:sugar ABC transporter ATP-binding protein n=1 Tax=Microbacterium sp. BR1 TaxID=1070896 RepID=UPI000C2CA9F8|nr:sugar ABC transporter ATP-binding protein [Microbacterium sp. BR1]